MTDLEAIRARLADHNVQAVARSTGLKPNVIYRFRDGKTSPRFATVAALLAYLAKQDGNNG